MTHKYTPRRCSKRWLDGDCPRGVLAIFDHPNEVERYTIFYSELIGDGRNGYIEYFGTSADLNISGHGDMRTHEAANYRYKNKHRYARWTDLPDIVKEYIRLDADS